jgi:hypothetical protein
MMNDVNCMTIDCKNVKNSPIVLEKFIEYRKRLHDIMGALINIDKQLAVESFMVPLLPELVQYMISKYKEYNGLCLDKYIKCIDVLCLPEQDLITLKNDFIRLQESEYLTTVIKLCKNISKLEVDYKTFVIGCKHNNAVVCFIDGLAIKADAKFALRANTSQLVSDMCELWSEYDIDNEQIHMSMVSLHQHCKAFQLCRQRPDIDIDEIFSMLMKYMRSMRNEISGCDGAFDIVERSSELFKSNYTKYYKAMIKTGSPVSIIEEFTSDVITNTTGDAGGRELKQLRKMARHMKKLISRVMQNKNQKMPQHVKDMMDKMDSYFEEILDNESDDVANGGNVDQMNKEFDQLLNL